MTTPPSDDGHRRRADDNPYVLAEIRREELSRLASIDANNKRLAEATEALILALENFATKEEVDLKVTAIDKSRVIIVKRVVLAFVAVGVFILAGIASTVTYVVSQQNYHHHIYQNCLQRNKQTDALRTYAENRIAAGHRNLAHLPQASVDSSIHDLQALHDGYVDVDCTKA